MQTRYVIEHCPKDEVDRLARERGFRDDDLGSSYWDFVDMDECMREIVKRRWSETHRLATRLAKRDVYCQVIVHKQERDETASARHRREWVDVARWDFYR